MFCAFSTKNFDRALLFWGYMVSSLWRQQRGYYALSKCGYEESKVVDSRSSDNNDAIRCRCECIKCGYRFTILCRLRGRYLRCSQERYHTEPFDRQKLMRALSPLGKRDIAVERLDALIDAVESARDGGPNETSSEDLSMCLRATALDKVAYIRFASVYRDFKDVDEF